MRGNALQMTSNSNSIQQTTWIQMQRKLLERDESTDGVPTRSDVDWKGDVALLWYELEKDSVQARVVVMQDIDWLQNWQ